MATTEALPSLPCISKSSYSRSSKNRSADGSTIDTRNDLSRSSSMNSEEAAGNRTECLTSLSALYRSAYKPYQFTHMYGTKYNQDFQGRFVPPPLPDRQSTARFAPMNYASMKTTYQQEFRDKEPLGKPLIMPISRNRKHRPHPNLRNTWQYPNSSRWIWSTTKPEKTTLNPVYEQQIKQRKTQSAGFFKGKPDEIRTHRWCSR